MGLAPPIDQCPAGRLVVDGWIALLLPFSAKRLEELRDSCEVRSAQSQRCVFAPPAKLELETTWSQCKPIDTQAGDLHRW